jgi:hypothetical protein
MFSKSVLKGLTALPDEEMPGVMRAIVAYIYGEEIPPLSPLGKFAFETVRADIDMYNEKYETVCEKHRSAGSKGGQAKAANLAKVGDVANVPNAKNIANVPNGTNVPDGLNDGLNDGVSDKDQDIKTHVRSGERTGVDEPDDIGTESSDPPAEKPSEDGGARGTSCGKGIEYTADFEKFWEVYPRRVRKRDAFTHWKPVIAKGSSAAEIAAAAKAYAAAMRYLERAPDKIMHPQSFIMANRWRDWLPPDGPEYLEAQETYRRTRRAAQPRARPTPDPDRYEQYNDVIANGYDHAGEEDST